MNNQYSLLPFINWVSIFLIGLIGLGCANTKYSQSDGTSPETLVATSDDPVYSVFLVGDAGAASLDPLEPSLQTLKSQLDKSGKQGTVIFLGDNIYPSGLPAEGTRSRKRAERRLMAQLKTVEDFSGRIIFLPGNHDWHSSKRKGLQRIRRQERYIENYLNKGNTFLPDSGYPGPVSVSLVNTHTDTDPSLEFNIQVVVLDTQWWLHPHNKPLSPGINNEDEQKEKILEEVKDIVHRHQDDELIIAGHHPMFSYGRHGGKFPFHTHLLPPVLGSMYVAYRNIWGYHQDISSYSDFKNALLESFEAKDDLIYASGHEHSLQFIPHHSDSTRQYYLVSGSASRASYVKKLSGSIQTYRGKGFIAIRYYHNRNKIIQYWNQKGEIVFEKQISPIR